MAENNMGLPLQALLIGGVAAISAHIPIAGLLKGDDFILLSAINLGTLRGRCKISSEIHGLIGPHGLQIPCVTRCLSKVVSTHLTGTHPEKTFTNRL